MVLLSVGTIPKLLCVVNGCIFSAYKNNIEVLKGWLVVDASKISLIKTCKLQLIKNVIDIWTNYSATSIWHFYLINLKNACTSIYVRVLSLT